MVTFGLELGEHGEGEHHRVLVEAEHRLRICQHDGRVDDVRLLANGFEGARRREAKIGHETPTSSGTRVRGIRSALA